MEGSTPISRLEWLLAQDHVPLKLIEDVELAIFDLSPTNHHEAATILAVATSWCQADCDPDTRDKAHDAAKRVAAFLGGGAPSVRAYYGCGVIQDAMAS